MAPSWTNVGFNLQSAPAISEFVSALSDAREINEDFSLDGAGLGCTHMTQSLIYDLRYTIYEPIGGGRVNRKS